MELLPNDKWKKEGWTRETRNPIEEVKPDLPPERVHNSASTPEAIVEVFGPNATVVKRPNISIAN